MVALTTSLVFKDGDTLFALGLEDSKPLMLDPQKMPNVQFTAAYAFGVEAISKRHFKTPLNSSKFKQVAPALLNDSTLDDVKKVQVLDKKDTDTAVAFSFDSDKALASLNNELNDISSYINTGATVLEGAQYLVPNKESFVVLAKFNGLIHALLVSDHKLRDFRCVEEQLWPDQALLTLRALLSDDTRILNFGVKVPLQLQGIMLKGYMPKELPDNYALPYGLIMALEQGSAKLTQDISSKTLIKKRAKFYRHSLKILSVVAGAFVLISLILGVQNYQLSSIAEQFINKKDQLFEEALPNTPQIAPELQLEQRLRELQVAGGFQTEYEQGLLGSMQQLMDALSQKDYIKLENIKITDDKITFKAQVEKLSQTDELKKFLSEKFVTANLRLSSVQVSGNSVKFQMDISF